MFVGLKDSLKTDSILAGQTTIRMAFYNTQMELSNDFNPMHAVIVLAGSQFCLLLIFCLSSSENYKAKYRALKQEHDTLQRKNEKDVADYNKLADEHNTLLEKNEKDVADYNKLVAEFNELTDETEKNIIDYNDLAEAYNDLLDESDTRVSRLESRLKRNRKY